MRQRRTMNAVCLAGLAAVTAGTMACGPTKGESTPETRPSPLIIDLKPDGTRNRLPRAVQRSITYCVSDAFNDVSGGVKAAIVGGMADAAAAWAGAADVRFVHESFWDFSCTGNNGSVNFNVSLDTSAGNGGAFAPFPDMTVRKLGIGCNVGGSPPGCEITNDRDYYRRLLIHELGHVLGFVHEFQHSGGPGDPCAGDPARQEELTEYDPESALNYVVGNPPPCVGTAITTRVTDLDRQGVQKVYGIPWEGVGNSVQGTPAVASWGPERLDVFARGQNNELLHRWYDGRWHDWESLGGTLTSPPAAVSWGPGRIDVVARLQDGRLYQRWYDGQWHGWDPLGLEVASGTPAVASWGPNRLDVFAQGPGNQLWHRWYENRWFDWEPLGGEISSGVAAVSWGVGRIDVIVKGTDGQLHTRWFDGRWNGWAPLGSPPFGTDSDPAIDARGPGLLDIYVVSSDGTANQLYRRSFAGGWGDFQWLGDFHRAGGGQGVGVVSWDAGRIDLFALRDGVELKHAWFSGGAWR